MIADGAYLRAGRLGHLCRPDLIEGFKHNDGLADYATATRYTVGAKGYIDCSRLG
jgi:hypothetical protein